MRASSKKRKGSFKKELSRRLKRLRPLVGPARLVVRVALILLLVTVFILELRYLVFDMPLFRIRKVEVKAPDNIQVEQALRLGGVRLNQSSLKFEPEVVAKKIETMPHVKTVDVYQDSIDKIIIEIEERVPVAFIVGSAGRILEVDDEGFVLGEKSKQTPSALPFITGTSVEMVEKGFCIVDSSLKEVLGWLDPLKMFFDKKVAEINIGNPHARYIYTVDGIKIYLNNVEELRSQLPFIRRALEEVEKKYSRIDYIDVRYKCGLIVKPERGLL